MPINGVEIGNAVSSFFAQGAIARGVAPYVGQNGKILTWFYQFDGFNIYLMVYVLLVSWFFISVLLKIMKGEGEQGDGTKAFGWSLLAALTSYIYWGNALTSIMFIGLLAGMFAMFLNVNKKMGTGTSFQRRTINEMGGDSGLFKNIFSRLRRAKRMVAKNKDKDSVVKAASKEEYASAEVTQNLTGMEVQEEAFAAGSKKLAENISAAMQAEKITEEHKNEVLKHLEAFEKSLDSVDPSKLDETMRKAFLEAGKTITQNLSQWKDLEKGNEKKMQEREATNKKVLGMMNQSMSHAITLDNGLIGLENRIKTYNRKEIQALNERIKEKEKKADSLAKIASKTTDKATKASIERQVSKVNDEIKKYKLAQEKINNIQSGLRNLRRKLIADLRQIKKALNLIKKQDSQSKKFEGNEEAYKKQTEKLLDELQSDSVAMESEVEFIRMEKAQAENAGVRLTAAAGKVFTSMFEIEHNEFKHENDNTYPLISSVAKSIQGAMWVEKGIEMLDRSSYRFNQGMEILNQIAASILNNEKSSIQLQKNQNVDAFLEKVLKADVYKEGEVKKFFEDAYNTLQQTADEIKDNLPKIEQSAKNINDTKDHTLNVFTKMMEAYVKQRNKIADKALGLASTAQSAIKAAVYDIKQAKKDDKAAISAEKGGTEAPPGSDSKIEKLAA